MEGNVKLIFSEQKNRLSSLKTYFPLGHASKLVFQTLLHVIKFWQLEIWAEVMCPLPGLAHK